VKLGVFMLWTEMQSTDPRARATEAGLATRPFPSGMPAAREAVAPKRKARKVSSELRSEKVSTRRRAIVDEATS
jgi:hypothetical protein